MLIDAKYLKGLTIGSRDGEIGTVEEFYLDDETWHIRYFVVDLSNWPGGRKVLISPRSILRADWQARHLDAALTKKQVEDSPDIDTKLPVSRQYERDYLDYYNYNYYWGDSYVIGPWNSPGAGDLLTKSQAKPADTHLRSSDAVGSYNVEAEDGDMGHVAGFILDEDTWAVRYIEVATRNWWPGKKVLVSPAWIVRVSWADSTVYTGLTRKAIQSAPAYLEGAPISREYEDRLHAHYGRNPYWLGENLAAGKEHAAFAASHV